MSDTSGEIASQPASWRRAARIAPSHETVLPAVGERVAAIGCGTSWFVAQSYAALREAQGAGETEAFTPTEFPARRRYDRALVISRSGTTTETVDVIRQLEGTPVTAITAVAASPVGRAATNAIVLDFADERSVVQTRFATTTLALLRAGLGHDVEGAAHDVEAALEADLPHDPSSFEHFAFLGHGWTVGLAHEAALKLREAAQAHTESYPAMEYRHGPMSLAGPSTLVWILGTPDPAVADDVRTTGATVRVGDLDPLAELVLIQRTAVQLADARGLDPDHPPHLTRSVVLS